jgi:isocitrate/isopropylmalate dehydrogenase
MKTYRIATIPGDGIGKEVVPAGQQVLEALAAADGALRFQFQNFDVLASAIGEKLSQTLGQPVIVESKPGAGATLGADHVAKSKPDGHTLF